MNLISRDLNRAILTVYDAALSMFKQSNEEEEEGDDNEGEGVFEQFCLVL